MNATIETQAPEAVVFEIPAYNEAEFDKRVEKTNRRLAKSGGTEHFAFTSEDFQKPSKENYNQFLGVYTGPVTYETWVRKTLVNDSFRIAVGDFTFVASLVREEAGYVVHTAPEQNLDGWARPAADDIHCDVCGTDRRRVNIYIIRDETSGELLQVGSNCIAPKLGMTPANLWALTFIESLADLAEGDSEGFSGHGQRAASTDIDYVLAAAWSFTHQGKNYVSTKMRDVFGAPTPTADKVKAHIFFPPRAPKSNADYREQQAWQEYLEEVAAIDGILKDEALLAEIKASAQTVKAGTDYGDNLRTILAAESGRVTSRNVGILASLVSVYAREKDLVETRRNERQQAAQGFLAPVGERVRDFHFTLTSVREFEGGFGWTTLLVGRTDEGHTLKWFASGRHDYSVGDTVSLKAATVKAHENYNGVDQTVLTRGKFAAAAA